MRIVRDSKTGKFSAPSNSGTYIRDGVRPATSSKPTLPPKGGSGVPAHQSVAQKK